MTEYFKKPRSSFIKVECSNCGHKQVIFESPAGKVTCQQCRETIAESTGGKAKIDGKVTKKLE